MRAYVQAIWQCRYFWLSLVTMDLRTRYRRSVLGLGWSLIHPLAMTVTLCLVFHTIFNLEPTEYGPFLLCGLAFWNYLTLNILQGCQCLQQGESYIRQYPAPMAIYPLRTMLGAGFHFLVTLVIVLVLSGVFRGFTSAAPLLSLPLCFVLLAVFGWALAVIFGFLNVYFPDLRHLVDILLQLLFYLTPVIYPPELLRSRSMGMIIDLNPLAAMIELLRAPILDGRFPSWPVVNLAVGLVAVLTGLAVVMLARLERRLVYHL